MLFRSWPEHQGPCFPAAHAADRLALSVLLPACAPCPVLASPPPQPLTFKAVPALASPGLGTRGQSLSARTLPARPSQWSSGAKLADSESGLCFSPLPQDHSLAGVGAQGGHTVCVFVGTMQPMTGGWTPKDAPLREARPIHKTRGISLVPAHWGSCTPSLPPDRKSTRLNSSH